MDDALESTPGKRLCRQSKPSLCSHLVRVLWAIAILAGMLLTDLSICDKPFLASIALTVLGGLLNAAAVCLNGGRMPVRTWRVPDEHQSTHCEMTDRTRVRWLCDWIPVRSYLYSPGDFSVMTGQTIVLTWIAICFVGNGGGI